MSDQQSVYRQNHDRASTDPQGYWAEQAAAVKWFTAPTQILDTAEVPSGRWFTDGVLNTSYNALDRHVIEGRGEQPALVHHSAITGKRRTFTYAELLDHTARLAGALSGLGVEAGDRVVIYLPMIPEAAIAMLACARIGAIHSVVFGGFAASELATRIDDAAPKVVISASCGLEANRVIEYKPLLDKALEKAEHQPQHCIIVQRPEVEASLLPGRDLVYSHLMKPGSFEPAVPVMVDATDPLYILYTSGTTGRPKGIVRDNGGHAVALTYAMATVYDVGPGEVMFTASDVGWVVGHSFIVYGPLLVGATTVMYEGKPVGTPDAGEFWRLIAEHRVKALFTAPTAIRAIRKVDPEGEFVANSDLSSLQTLFLAGERTDPDTLQWAEEQLAVPVIDNWWQTETGWPIASNLRGLDPMPIKPGSATVPVPGYDVQVLDPAGERVEAGVEGAVCIELPLPPGNLVGVWGDPERFQNSYFKAFPGYYSTGDGGYLDSDGYLFVMGRTDDVINVAGHRLSTGSMEAVLATHPAVAECAVIGVADELKGQQPRGLVVLKQGVSSDIETVRTELVELVREEIGAVASLRRVDVVDALPKTRSGKVLRRTMREIAEGKDAMIPSTIEDPAVIEALRGTLAAS